jgi:hypothetical protein
MEDHKHGGKREGAGRKPGSVNKLSMTVKQNVINVFDRLGGEDHMVEWATENPNQFYNIYAKLMPTQSELGTIEGQESPLNVTLNFVKPDHDRDNS